MFIEKRKAKGKIKYFLSHTFREGGKVHKIRRFLGADLTPDLLKERKEKTEGLILEEVNEFRIISDPLHKPLSPGEIDFVKDLEKKANLKVIHLSEEQWKLFSEAFTYNTNAIEGSELNKKEVKEIIEHNKWPEFATKTDIAEAYGLNEAVSYIRETKDHVSINLIKKLHHLVFQNSKDFAGELRGPGQEVVVRNMKGEILHQGAPQSRVVSLLNELILWYNQHKNDYPPLVLAAVVHNQFETIHPFADGNGRVGRLLLNNILIKHGLPPVNIDLKNRGKYYHSLQTYQKEHNLQVTIEFILKEYKNLKKIINS